MSDNRRRLKTLVILPVYNTQERAQALLDALAATVELPYDLAVIDNGSAEKISFAQARLETNIGFGGAIWYGIDWFGGTEYDYYWILSTSTAFTDPMVDPLAELLAVCAADPQCVGVGPAWVGKIGSWPHRYNMALASQPRPIINTAALWDRRWFERVGGFDRRLKSGWGSDFELGWKARRELSGGWGGIHSRCPAAEQAVFSRQVIVHYKFLVRSLAEREQMAARYDALRPGAGSGPYRAFTLPERMFAQLELRLVGAVGVDLS